MKKFIFSMFILLTLANCSRKTAEAPAPYADISVIVQDSSNRAISSSAAVEKDSKSKFIRTADLKFKVTNVINTTYAIENITLKNGGYVGYTKLESVIDNTNTTKISADSLLETTFFTLTNSIVIRVPNYMLDTTLKEISKHIQFLDYRIIKAEDVSMQILSNDLSQKRYYKNEERLKNAIDNKGKKLMETTISEEMLLNKQEQSDNAKISNLALKNQISLSTINIYIYQRQSIKREIIPNIKNIDEYKQGFFEEIVNSIKVGWSILEFLFIYIIRLWSIALIGFITYMVIKKIKHL